ncbi:hypothetical protein BGZ99_007893 [Dissophora globulifera]|uniref:Uncharacterized protein n=1 Tax=Dissophora globulifera TaxID=979702 RepID=A0A9P6UZ68_9FUNG|nr:hypothetical protein BGZ99_007893 [Dissophora globulifera]
MIRSIARSGGRLSIAGRDRSVGTEGQIATKKRLLEQLFVMMNQPQALVRMQKKRRYRSEEADRALLLETIRLNPFAQKIGQVAKAWEDVRDALGMKVHPRQCIRRVHRMIRPFQLRERMYRGHIPEEMREVNDDLVKQVLHLMRQGGHSSALEDDGDHWNDDDSGSGVSDTDDQDDVSMTLATPERLSQDDSLYDMSSTPAQHPVATHHHTDGGIAIDVSKSPDLPIGTKVIPSPIYDYGYPRSESPPTMERMSQLYGAILHEFHVVREYMSRIDRQRQRDKDNQKVMYRTMQGLQQQVQEQQWFIQGLERRIQHQQPYQSASSSSYQNDNSISKHHGRPSDEYVAPPTILRGNEESYVTQERDAFEISHFTSAKSYEHRSRSNATKSRH